MKDSYNKYILFFVSLLCIYNTFIIICRLKFYSDVKHKRPVISYSVFSSNHVKPLTTIQNKLYPRTNKTYYNVKYLVNKKLFSIIQNCKKNKEITDCSFYKYLLNNIKNIKVNFHINDNNIKDFKVPSNSNISEEGKSISLCLPTPNPNVLVSTKKYYEELVKKNTYNNKNEEKKTKEVITSYNDRNKNFTDSSNVKDTKIINKNNNNNNKKNKNIINEQDYKKEDKEIKHLDKGNVKTELNQPNQPNKTNEINEPSTIYETDNKNDNDRSSEKKNVDDEKKTDVFEEDHKYSRQIYAIGYEEEKKLRKGKILLIGLNGASAEICKNLSLCGVQQISIYDNDILRESDLDNLFLCDKKLVNKEKKSFSCFEKLQHLNKNCKIRIVTELSDEEIENHDIIVAINQKQNVNIQINTICRKKNKKFIYLQTVGVFGHMFVDFGDFEFTTSGNKQQYKINKVEKKKDKLLLTYASFFPIDLNEGDEIIVNLENEKDKEKYSAICSINEILHKEEKIVVSLKNNESYSFTKEIEFAERYLNSYESDIVETFHNLFFVEYLKKEKEKKKRDDFLKLCKMNPLKITLEKVNRKKILIYKSLEYCLNNLKRRMRPSLISSLCFFLQKKELTDEELCFLCYDELKEAKRKEIYNFRSNDWKEFKNLCKKRKRTIQNKKLEEFACTAHIELTPISIFWGALLSQEIIKGLVHKFQPIHQFFYYDRQDLLKISNISNKYYGKYMNHLNFFGKSFHNFLKELNILLIGSGALGCEFLKLLALAGVSSKREIKTNDENINKNILGGLTVVVDYDRIEESNLTRQFLFHEKNIGDLKCKVAAENIKKINEDMNTCFIQMRVDESILEDKSILLSLFDKKREIQDKGNERNKSKNIICILSLDNIKSRILCDKFCKQNSLPVIEAGIEGLKGSSQIVFPFASKSYSDDLDLGYGSEQQEEEITNSCTVTSFPRNFKHIVAYSRGVYNNYFYDQVLKMNNFLNDPLYTIGEICKYESDIENLKNFFKTTKTFFHVDFNKKIQDLWNSIFVNNILNLLNSDDKEIWSYFEKLNKLPKPLYFNKENRNHVLFHKSAINIYNRIFTNLIKVNNDSQIPVFILGKDTIVPNLSFQEAITKIIVSNGIIFDLKKFFYFLSVIKKNTDTEEYEYVEKEFYELFNNPVFIKALKYVQKKKAGQDKKNEFSFFIPLMYNTENDKNDEDFLFSVTNIRNQNYNFSNLNRLDFLRILNNIIPSIATTVSVITSLAMIELYKVAYFLKESQRINAKKKLHRKKYKLNFKFVFNKQEVKDENKNESRNEVRNEAISEVKNEDKIEDKSATLNEITNEITNETPNESRDNYEEDNYKSSSEYYRNGNEKQWNNENFIKKKEVKNIQICTYKNKVIIKKDNQILFYFFNMNYKNLQSMISLLYNQYINLEDNFLTKSKLSNTNVYSFNDLPIKFMETVKFSDWSYIYIDIFSNNKESDSDTNKKNLKSNIVNGKENIEKEKNVNDEKVNKEAKIEEKCIIGCCGFPKYLFNSEEIDYLSPKRIKHIKNKISQLVTFINKVNEDSKKEKQKEMLIKLKKWKQLNEDILLMGKSVKVLLAFLNNNRFKKKIINMNKKKKFLSKYVQPRLDYVAKKLISKEGKIKSCFSLHDIILMQKHVEYINLKLEELKEEAFFLFHNYENYRKNKNDITLQELINYFEFLFNVNIESIHMGDKILFFKFPTFFKYEKNEKNEKPIYNILMELFKDEKGRNNTRTFILNIVATDKKTGEDVLLPDVQVNIHRHN